MIPSLKKPIFVFALFFFSIAGAEYVKPAHVDTETWNKLSPYFLPFDHPVRPELDKLFSKRVSETRKTMREAGFRKPVPRPFSKTVVSKHPRLKGVIVKLFTDERDYDEVDELMRRIIGAQAAQDSIDRHGYQSMFVVPKKWIYPLPENPAPPPAPHAFRKNFILVAEDMEIFGEKNNFLWWRSNAVTKKMLDALYVINQECGFDDSFFPPNIPFTKYYKIAFIDTAICNKWPLRFYKLEKYLSKPMKKHWKTLIDQNGPSS